MELMDLLGNYPVLSISGSSKITITGIEHDSRKVRKGNIFIAIKGFSIDGHLFIHEAIRNGAIAILVEREINIKEEVTTIRVQDTLDALGYITTKFYKTPWEDMGIIGITGTNGKTSTSYYIKSILESDLKKVGLLGTMGSIIDNLHEELKNTTPDSLEIQKHLSEMAIKSVDVCVMEVSSHGLALKRVKYMDFNIGIFTNLSKDHLDYHKTMYNYLESKLKLFYKTNYLNIINIDDPAGKEIINKVGNKTPYLTYGIKEKAHVYATNIEYNMDSVYFTLNTPTNNCSIRLNTPGQFSVYNSLAAAACAYSLGTDIIIIKKGLEAIAGIKGRFELVPINKEFNVIIDFAHTPDSLDKVLASIKEFAKGRIIVVFGAGGNRDKFKRPDMGRVVSQYADIAIITSDNPRNEDPEEIINDIIEGIINTSFNYIKIIDRKEAIEYAMKIAKKNDLILLAGKGHEEYTIIGNKVYPFNERQIIIDSIKNI